MGCWRCTQQLNLLLLSLTLLKPGPGDIVEAANPSFTCAPLSLGGRSYIHLSRASHGSLLKKILGSHCKGHVPIQDPHFVPWKCLVLGRHWGAVGLAAAWNARIVYWGAK